MHIGNEWDALLADEIHKDYYLKLRQFLISEYTTRRIYPPMEDIFNALRHTSYSDVRAVILGQDPYHGPGQAHGMCFSVKRGTPPPPSLQNIFKEIKSDLGIDPPQHGELTSWADNGVLLLNTVLTVREGQPNSHKGMGWEQFTDRIIQLLNERQQPMVFLLWGGNARSKARLITNPAHLVLQCAHPSPLSAYNGFFGCRHFSKTNEFLVSRGMEADRLEAGLTCHTIRNGGKHMYSDDELFDVLNDSGERTETTKRRGDIHRDGDWHASVHIWIARRRISGMEFLLQKRADDKDSFPGCWDAASTGHIDAGEDAISAAIRELREELGIRARPSEFVLLFRRKVSEDNIFHGKRFLNNELKWVFLYKGALADTSIHFEEEEISGVEWQNAVSIRKALEKKDPGYCIDLQEFREVQTCAGDILP